MGHPTWAIVPLFYSGWSMLATGLSRKEDATEMRCGNCGMRWTV